MVKVATKGQREISEGNEQTLREYGLASAAAVVVYLIVAFIWDVGTAGWVGFTLSTMAEVFSLFFMRSISRPKRDQKGHVVDAGMDLNDPGAVGESTKDVIILCVLCQALSLISSYFFWFLLAAPGYAFYKFFVGILLPWATAPAPETEIDEKKAKKKERAIRRM